MDGLEEEKIESDDGVSDEPLGEEAESEDSTVVALLWLAELSGMAEDDVSL